MGMPGRPAVPDPNEPRDAETRVPKIRKSVIAPLLSIGITWVLRNTARLAYGVGAAYVLTKFIGIFL